MISRHVSGEESWPVCGNAADSGGLRDGTRCRGVRNRSYTGMSPSVGAVQAEDELQDGGLAAARDRADKGDLFSRPRRMLSEIFCRTLLAVIRGDSGIDREKRRSHRAAAASERQNRDCLERLETHGALSRMSFTVRPRSGSPCIRPRRRRMFSAA